MIDKSLRNLERLQNQDPLRLKLLQRRLGQSVYIQEAPRPITVFNSTELLVDISKDENRHGNGGKEGTGDGYGDGKGYGFWLGDGFGDGHTSTFFLFEDRDIDGEGDGHGVEYGDGSGAGYGLGDGDGKGCKSGESGNFYTQKLRKKYG